MTKPPAFQFYADDFLAGTLEGIVAKRWLTMANVDGSGRRILIVTDGKTTKVRAGCFIGSPQEFSDKAKAENKPLYSTLVPFVANQLRRILGDNGPDERRGANDSKL
jgi:hypothetical protein